MRAEKFLGFVSDCVNTPRASWHVGAGIQEVVVAGQPYLATKSLPGGKPWWGWNASTQMAGPSSGRETPLLDNNLAPSASGLWLLGMVEDGAEYVAGHAAPPIGPLQGRVEGWWVHIDSS